jgi:hypothetical protein
MNFSTIEGTKYYGCNGFSAIELGDPTIPTNFSRTPLHLTYYPVVDMNGILISRSAAFTSGETSENESSE